MPNERREFRLWRSVVVRLLVIGFAGWLTVLWFQGCLVPAAKDDVRQEQEKAAGQNAPPAPPVAR
jgi:hypothetical protein